MATSLLNQILGPSYSYPKNIKSPRQMGFRPADSTKNFATNIGGLREYVEILATNPAYGNNFFLQSGTCDTSTSDESCKGKDRYIFVRNIPSGKIPCIGDPGISLDGGIGARGIIPGIMEDVIEINPLELPKAFLGMSKKFGYTCTPKTRTVGGVGENRKVETRCSPDIPDDACPFGGGSNKSKKHTLIVKAVIIVLFILLVIIVFISLTGKKNVKSKKKTRGRITRKSK